VDVARIRPYVAELLDIVQVELGLSLPALETMLWEIVDDIIDRLEALPPEPQRAARENRLDTIRMLRRIKRLIRGQFPLPVMDADRITDAIAGTLRRLNADALGRQAACVSHALGAISDAAHGVEELVPLGISQFGSLGAAAAATNASEQYCWYASWLLEDDVIINASRSEIRKGDEVIATGVNLTMADIPQFRASTIPHYTFKPVDLDAMEAMAFALYVAADGIDVLLHLTSLEEGDYANNALNAFFFAFVGVGKVVGKRPMMPSALESYVLPLTLSSFASFEGMHKKVSAGNWAKMWLTLLVPDMIETVIYRTVSSIVKDGFLSFFTLLNYDGEFYSSADPDPRPLNRTHIEGVVAIPGLFIGKFWQFSPSVFPREEYAPLGTSKDQTLKQIFYWNMLIGSLFGLLSRVSGCLLAMAVSRTFDPVAWATGLWRIPVSWITWFVSFYMSVEGDTYDGKFNPSGDPFDGYPAHDASPYSLPYAKGEVVYAVQGNQGMFSHHFLNVEQTYSYDFSMDQGDEILASRPGTVVDYFDWVPDDTNPDTAQMNAAAAEATASGFLKAGQSTSDSWNFIAIRHDCDDAGNALPAPDATHDKGPGGLPVTTYAIYGHGRKDSVRELFGARGVAENAIIGTQVKQGDRIMRAGSTGISFNNHLHMMVQAGPGTGSPVQRHTLARPTIPFVFKDVTHLFGRDGVCKSLNFYKSTTVDLQAAP
jgi:hypothetical protein